jgi:rare lipoprotein A
MIKAPLKNRILFTLALVIGFSGYSCTVKAENINPALDTNILNHLIPVMYQQAPVNQVKLLNESSLNDNILIALAKSQKSQTKQAKQPNKQVVAQKTPIKAVNQPKQQAKAKAAIQTNKKASLSYKSLANKENSPAVVYINGKEVVRYSCMLNGISPEKRAELLKNRLQTFLSQNGKPENILPGVEKGSIVGRAGNIILFTADEQNSKAFGLSPSGLAIHWINNIRVALGAPKFVRDHNLIASRGSLNISSVFASRYLGKEEFGVASWYGGAFHGRRAADGSRFDSQSFTAAHKSLPFGTLVKVTNLRNGKECIVKITDRGPYAAGRVIDLSRGAAREMGMISSGISKVKLEVIGIY